LQTGAGGISPTTGVPPNEQPASDAARLLEAREVAALLGVNERWVREHTRRGEIPHVRLGRYVRYRRESIMAWIEEVETHGLR